MSCYVEGVVPSSMLVADGGALLGTVRVHVEMLWQLEPNDSWATCVMSTTASPCIHDAQSVPRTGVSAHGLVALSAGVVTGDGPWKVRLVAVE